MARRTELLARATSLSASLAVHTREEQAKLAELEKLLVRSRIDEPALASPRELSVERSSLFSPENLSSERKQRFKRLVDSIPEDEQPKYRVFRRESPMVSSMLPLASPAWGAARWPRRV